LHVVVETSLLAVDLVLMSSLSSASSLNASGWCWSVVDDVLYFEGETFSDA
jgi:hypothetical protein